MEAPNNIIKWDAWQQEFGTNLTEFTNQLAERIAQSAILEFQNTTNHRENHPFIKTIDFTLTNLSDILQNADPIEPFNEWFHLEEIDETDLQLIYNRINDVAQAAKNQLIENFLKPRDDFIKFNVTLVESDSATHIQELTIKLWEQKEFPDFDLKALQKKRLDQRAAWEDNFEKNHEAFADHLAKKITQNVIAQFKEVLQNPYEKTSFTSTRPFKTLVLLDEFKELQTLYGEEIPLSPFSDWMAALTDNDRKLNRFDHNYINNCMSIVGELTQERLQTSFTTFKNENNEIDFHISWNNNNLSPSSSSNTLGVLLWLDQQPVDNTTKTGVLQEHQLKYEKAKASRIQLCQVLTISAVAVIWGALMANVHFNND